jgi:hypothetical protein
MKRRTKAIRTILAARAGGATLRGAAAAAGVHVATVCRWQARDPALAEALRDAARDGWRVRHPPRRRPVVPYHPLCPACRAPVVTRRTWGFIRFWGCSRWPWCRWGSWRPRYPTDCLACGGPRYWSHSRLSVACDRCRTRATGLKCEFGVTIKKGGARNPRTARRPAFDSGGPPAGCAGVVDRTVPGRPSP